MLVGVLNTDQIWFRQQQKRNDVGGVTGRLTLFNRAVQQVLTGIDALEGT